MMDFFFRTKPISGAVPIFPKRSRSLLLLAALGLLVSGCSTRSDLHFTTLMVQVPGTKAIMMPPPGGPAIVGVLERRYQNGISQEIALSTKALGVGQNTFWISMMNDPQALTEVEDTLKIGRLDPEKIQSEMDDRLLGIDMHTSLFFVQNKYGPFGYAIGTSSSHDLCLYAWQQIEPTENAIFTTSGIISVRMRLCETGATEEQLLQVMYGYTISAYYTSRDWDPYGSPPPVSPQLGAIDAPVYPLGMNSPLPAPHPLVLPSGAPTSRPAASSRPVQPREAPTARRPAGAPANDYPVVPPPPPS